MSHVLYAVLYAALVVATLDTAVRGRPTLIYAAALMLPMIQLLPSPVAVIGAPANLIVLGLLFGQWTLRGKHPAQHVRLPLRVPIAIFVAALLSGVAIRGIREQMGLWFVVPFGDVVQTAWNWLAPLLMYALTFRFVGDTKTAENTIRFCQVSVGMECAIGVLDRLRGMGRATAQLGEPNRAGAYFAGASGFFLAWFLMARGPKKIAFFVAWLLSVGALLATLSRGGLLAGALANAFVLVVFFARARGHGATKALVVALVVVAGLNLGLLLPERVKERVMKTFGGEEPVEGQEIELDGSSASRLEYWATAWQLFKAEPIGHGTLSFPQRLQEVHGGQAKQAHNVFLQYAVENGIQGIFALVLLTVAVLRHLRKTNSLMPEGHGNALLLSLTAWWIAHVIAHNFTNSFFTTHVIGQFWIMLACVPGTPARAARDTTTRTSDPERSPRESRPRSRIASSGAAR